MTAERKITARGAATRARIIEAATELVASRGVGGTSLDDIGAGTATSKSQLFHYFPGGKVELVTAIADHYTAQLMEMQEPYLSRLASWEDWQDWREAIVAHYGSRPSWGCAIGTMASELAGTDPVRAAQVGRHLEDWRLYFEAGLERMVEAGNLSTEADPKMLSYAVFSALQGGLILTQTAESIEPLEASLDGVLALLHGAAVEPTRAQAPKSRR